MLIMSYITKFRRKYNFLSFYANFIFLFKFTPFYIVSYARKGEKGSNCEYMNEQIQHSNEFIHNCLQKKNFSLFEKKGLNRTI